MPCQASRRVRQRGGELARADPETLATIVLRFCAHCREALMEAQRQHEITGAYTAQRERDLDALTRAGQRMGVLPPGGGRPN